MCQSGSERAHGKGKRTALARQRRLFLFWVPFFYQFAKGWEADGQMEATAALNLRPLPCKFTVWGLGRYLLALLGKDGKLRDPRFVTEHIFLTCYFFGIKTLLESCHFRRPSNYRTGQVLRFYDFFFLRPKLVLGGVCLPSLNKIGLD